MNEIDFNAIETPAYIVDERLLEQNLKLIRSVMDRTGCKILLAQKGFSMFSEYPLIGKYLCGTTASSLNEARLGAEYMEGETHIFAPAYQENEFEAILDICDHIVFNTLGQWQKFCQRIAEDSNRHTCGLRVNPEYAEVEHEIYNPCCEGSRFGVTAQELANAVKTDASALDGLDGIHFHAMCEQNSDTLERILDHVEDKFGDIMALPQIQWVNFGGGHHITRADYDVELLIRCIRRIQDKYKVTVYLEPGEAVALNTGYLVATVMDVQTKQCQNDAYTFAPAILDASAACHMPDVLEMPYRPVIIGSGLPGEKSYTYRFGGNTCLAGDIIGDYSFDAPLTAGDKLVFTDMAHYSMVKNNTFNGINLPSILSYNDTEGIKIIKRFGYEDFRNRLS